MSPVSSGKTYKPLCRTLCAAFLVTGCTTSAPPPEKSSSSSVALSPLPAQLWGVTIDDVSNQDAVVSTLGALPQKPIARVVFDETQSPSYYAQAVPAIHEQAYVMGEILDSYYVPNLSVTQYVNRTQSYLDNATVANAVDVWEVGNEINGEWVPDPNAANAAQARQDVASKMSGAFDRVKAAGRRTALTLYACDDSSDPTFWMFNWANEYVPSRMLTGLDYVLVSYYEGDCGAPRSDWQQVFDQLHAMFPNAALGFGEVGYVDGSGKDLALSDPTHAVDYFNNYYQMQIATPGYVGGYFWWYAAEDMVPSSQPLFSALSSVMTP